MPQNFKNKIFTVMSYNIIIISSMHQSGA